MMYERSDILWTQFCQWLPLMPSALEWRGGGSCQQQQLQMLLAPLTYNHLWWSVLSASRHVYSVSPDLFHDLCLFGVFCKSSRFPPPKTRMAWAGKWSDGDLERGGSKRLWKKSEFLGSAHFISTKHNWGRLESLIFSIRFFFDVSLLQEATWHRFTDRSSPLMRFVLMGEESLMGPPFLCLRRHHHPLLPPPYLTQLPHDFPQKVTKGQWSSPSGNDAHAARLQIIYQVRGGSFASVRWAARDLALRGKQGVG